MWRLTVSSFALVTFCGCAALWEKVGDPAIAMKTAEIGSNLQKMGDATGFPYAGAGLATLGMFAYLLFGAKKKNP
jgi:hypothetical protein